MRVNASNTILFAFTLAIGLGWGCAGGGGVGAGCGGLKPLPMDPPPRGMPHDQEIEGGMQVRVTKPGFDKVSSLIPALAGPQLTKAQCLPKQQQKIGVGFLSVTISECNGACNGGQGCPIGIALRPDLAPPGGIAVSMDPGNNPAMHVDAAFDIHIPIDLKVEPLIGNVCTLNIDAKATHINADIGLGIDGPGGPSGQNTGELTIALNNLKLVNLDLQTSNCGLFSDVFNAVLGMINAFATSFIGDLLINLIKPQLSKLVEGFLPKPPGIAGSINTGAALAKFDAPADANLELYVAAGGYVSSSNGGLNLGMITGFNSDSDPSTRGPGLTSEAELCVPVRPAPDLGGPPWMLPLNAVRTNHLLDVAPEFSGMPDPTDMNGAVKDLAIGVSRSFLDLVGFHVYNSGTLCLAVGGSTLAQLNAGTVSLLIPSLSNILEDRKAPLALVIRPEQPLVFTLGAGTMQDPLLHVGVTDLRIDFYAFIEERYVRIFTFALDANIGINLTVTMDQNGNPAIAPMITGIDKNSVNARVTNNDLLNEDPNKLAKALLSLIDIAVGQVTGALKPIALPALQGFSIDGLEITRVQTQQDDFLAIFGDLVQNPQMMMAEVSPLVVPLVRAAHGAETIAQVVDFHVPPPDQIRAAVLSDQPTAGGLPTVTLALGGSGGVRPLEWSVRVDNGTWHPWSSDPRPAITDPAFVLQGKHHIDVRAREQGDWTTEDQSPVGLDVIIDSTPPELHPLVTAGSVEFRGWDNVSDDAAIRYAWSTQGGWTDLAARGVLTVQEALQATGGGVEPLQVKAVDEAGNQTISTIDLSGLTAFHGRESAPQSNGGCGSCSLGAAPSRGSWLFALLALAPLGGLALRRRLRRFDRKSDFSLPAGALLALIAATVAGGCSQSTPTAGPCKVDDDCRTETCDGGIPHCNADGTCGCATDIPLGDIGRFQSMEVRGALAYIAAYNNSYGDLMIGHIAPPGIVTNWEFVDGVPLDSATTTNPESTVRGGITDPGDDVGRYVSLAITPEGDPVMAYYDLTHLSLKYASFGAVRWHAHTIDMGSGDAKTPGNDFGKYASLTLDVHGIPGIAYYAEVKSGASGMREGQLRWAQAKTPYPSSASDWTIATIETHPLPPPDPMSPTILADGNIFCAAARKSDGSPVIAYYDRLRGNLRYVEWDPMAKQWGMPTILDGEDAQGNDTGDVGWYPSMAVDGDVVHIAYGDATRDALRYYNTADQMVEVADDGWRLQDEMTLDGLDAPVHHVVGEGTSIQVLQGVVTVAYLDATSVQLLYGVRDPMTKKWSQKAIAGHATPFAGAYGFYPQNRIFGGSAVLSSYVINQHPDQPAFWVETFALNLNTVM